MSMLTEAGAAIVWDGMPKNGYDPRLLMERFHAVEAADGGTGTLVVRTGLVGVETVPVPEAVTVAESPQPTES